MEDEASRGGGWRQHLIWLVPVLALVLWEGYKAYGTRGVFDEWYLNAPGYTEAVALHQKTGQPVMVYFHTHWCGYCKKLERNLLSQKAVQQGLSGVIKVSINPEVSTREDAIGEQWGVQGYPTLYVVGDWSKPYQRLVPYVYRGGRAVMMNPREFVAAVKRAAR